MQRTMVRYTVKDGRGPENARDVERVFAELAERAPKGIRYTAYRLDDGRSFVHLVERDDAGADPLTALPAFRAFVAAVRERCEHPPVVTPLHAVGSYRPAEAGDGAQPGAYATADAGGYPSTTGNSERRSVVQP